MEACKLMVVIFLACCANVMCEEEMTEEHKAVKKYIHDQFCDKEKREKNMHCLEFASEWEEALKEHTGASDMNEAFDKVCEDPELEGKICKSLQESGKQPDEEAMQKFVKCLKGDTE